MNSISKTYGTVSADRRDIRFDGRLFVGVVRTAGVQRALAAVARLCGVASVGGWHLASCFVWENR